MEAEEPKGIDLLVDILNHNIEPTYHFENGRLMETIKVEHFESGLKVMFDYNHIPLCISCTYVNGEIIVTQIKEI